MSQHLNAGWQVTAPLAQQLAQQLEHLAHQARQIDEKAPAWQRRDWFDSELFQCHSPHLLDYVHETISILQRLRQPLPSQGQLRAIQQANQQRLAEKLAAQIQALTRAFACLAIRQRERGKWQPRPPKNSTNSIAMEKRQQAGKLLAELGGNQQLLYQKLSETLEFERRLQELIQQATEPERQLALHARLGRCRRAISEIEAEIQWFEQKRDV